LTKLLKVVCAKEFDEHAIDLVIDAADAEHDHYVSYERFVKWLFDPALHDHLRGVQGGHPAPSADAFTLMEFNVEEYYHDHTKRGGDVRSTVLQVVAGIRSILEAHSPDVLCLVEHSRGSGSLTEADIMEALAGGLGYAYESEPTGECPAWHSALANAVLWKEGKFSRARSWRVQLAGEGDLVPGTAQAYTPRSAACVELVRAGTGRRVVVCAAHLLGGRFEDKTFVAEHLAGRNVRVEQAQRVVDKIEEACGPGVPSVITGDFNTMLDGYAEGSAFRQTAQSYFEDKLRGAAVALARGSGLAPEADDYTFDFYASFQRRVHEVLRNTHGYAAAYGQSDAAAEMKTTHYSGCIDWIYIKNLSTMRDEQVISGVATGLSDHNAIMVTLKFA